MDPYSQPPTPLSPPPVSEPSNYLDTIAVQPMQPTMKPWLLWAMIGGVILVLVIAVFALSSAGGPSKTQRLQQFFWRMKSVSALAEKSKQTIKSSNLRAANSSLLTILSGAEQDGAAFLSAEAKKHAQPKTSKLLTEFSELDTTLEDARLNGIYDTVYARELAYQVATLQSDIQSLESGSGPELTAYLKKTHTNLEPIVKQFSEFNNSQS